MGIKGFEDWLVASNMVFSSTDHVTPFGVTFGGAYRSVAAPFAPAP